MPGLSYPLGASCKKGGVNFSIYSKHAEEVELLLFSRPNDDSPERTIRLDPKVNRTFHYWHCFIPGVKHGQIYGYRISGPFDPGKGLFFDSSKVLLDPYCLAVANSSDYDRGIVCSSIESCGASLKSVVVDNSRFAWNGDRPPRTPYAESVIYELHVRGFTQNPNSGVSMDKRGSYAGLIEKIPYLKSLGVTAVELMPVCQFDDQDVPVNYQANYWGYSPIAFFAPHSGYSSRKEPAGAVYEFCEMVRELHNAGIEVILDVVFNHTAEGDHRGPTLSFRGIDNPTYYILDGKGVYANYSGCGNSIKANHPVVQKFILDCLRYWVTEMHVDGFRFDLASVLTRDVDGNPQSVESSAVLQSIESDPVLAGVKLIAEAWDSAGLYQVGAFINASDWYAEWNGPFRDDIRRFVKGDNGTTHRLAQRIAGSSDIYLDKNREPNRSVHFITCHDGFTLNDLVSYNNKHNEANGEDNRDGTDYNLSWNCGIEGATNDSVIEMLRVRQIKNFLTVMFFSQGTPMLSMGDEVRRSQNGNNNAYAQDNETSWFDWSLIEDNKELLEFTKHLISFTQSLALMRQDHLMCTSTGRCCCPSISWHGVELNYPDWSYSSHSLAFSIHHPQEREHLHIFLNAYWRPIEFRLPKLEGEQSWYRIIDTDAVSSTSAVELENQSSYLAQSRSSVVLMARGVSDAEEITKRCEHECL